MKSLLGILLVWSAGQKCGFAGVDGFYIPSIAGAHLDPRAPQGSDNVNLSNVVGTAPSVITATATQSSFVTQISAAIIATTTDATTTSTNATNVAITLVSDIQGALASDTTSGATKTVTITSTDIAIVTPSSDPTSDTNTTSATVTPSPAANIAVDNGGFGGIAGVIVSASAPTAGAVVTVNDDQGFGGVVGVIQTSDVAASSSSSIDSTSSVVGVVTVTATTSDPITVTVTVDITTIPLLTDTASSPAAVASPPVNVIQNDAFGGVVGSQAQPTDLISTVPSFDGFGGVVGFATAPAQKRDVFSVSVTLDSSGGGNWPSET